MSESSQQPDHTEPTSERGAAHEQGTTHRKKGAYWAFAPVVLLGFLMSIVVTMVLISTNDPNFAVEPDYYQKAVDWDKKRAQDAENERLGWKVVWDFQVAPIKGGDSHVRIQLADRAGTAIVGAVVSVEAFHNAHAANIQRLPLRDLGEGRYEAALRLQYPGVWEFRLLVNHHGQVFTYVHRAEFARSSYALNTQASETAQRADRASSAAAGGL